MSANVSRRTFLRMAALGSAGAALAACQPQVVEKVVKETVVVKEEVTSVVEKIVTQPPAPIERQEIVLWWGSGVDLDKKLAQDPANSDALWAKWLIETFEERYSDIKIKCEDHGWDEPLRTGLLTAIAGGNVPEVTIGEAFVHEFATLGAFAEVNVDPDEFPWGCIAGSYMDGKVYGVPAFTSSFALEMNRKVVADSGLDPDFIPQTWDEILDLSRKIFTAGEEGKKWFGFTVYGPTPTRTYGAVLRAMPWINRTGGLIGDDAGTQAMFNDSRAIPAYQLLRDLFKTTDPGVSLSEHEQKVGGALWDNKSAYQVSATWDCYSAKRLEADTVYAPVPLCIEGCKRSNVVLGNLTFSPLKAAKNVRMGAKWCEFLAEADSQWQIAKIRGYVMPTIKRVLESPSLVQQPGYQGLEKQMAAHAEILLNEDLHPVQPYKKNPSRIWSLWSDVFGDILLTDEPINVLLDNMQAEVEKLLK
ncbi:MAG: extracellular solute-binding protein [Chloroflexi bacterium]|nr:extracellular solute-binding protein [Chloroflexota bacterium]